MIFTKDVLELIVPIITAVIAGWALLKVNRIDNQDKIRRALWSIERYLYLVGKCLENPNKENFELYTAAYLLANLYIAREWKIDLQTIDNLIRKGKMDEARENIIDLENKYYEKYKMNIYAPKLRRLKCKSIRKVDVNHKALKEEI